MVVVVVSVLGGRIRNPLLALVRWWVAQSVSSCAELVKDRDGLV